jgi:hypothetical protein
MSLLDFFSKKRAILISYLGAERLSEDRAAFVGPLLFERIAVTTTGFSRSLSPFARRASVRCVSEYSYKRNIIPNYQRNSF